MSFRTRRSDELLDKTLARMREDEADPATVERARARVLARLSQETTEMPADPKPIDTIRSCTDVQALLHAYRAGTLAEARALLVADHTRECVACRRALLEAAGALPRPAAPRRAVTSLSPARRWAIAASLLLVTAIAGAVAWQFLPAAPSRSAARVQEVDGVLFRVAQNRSISVAAGDEIPGGQVFRTAKGSRAVVALSDGSRIEMNERVELSVSARRADTTLHLTRGNIIVEAAKQGAKHLFVESGDCRVAVTGTIFSVNRGTKGSRVSVIEGEVKVRQSGTEAVLRPGDQISTHPSLEAVSLASEISWSEDVDRHLAILAELTRLRRDIDRLPHPKPRHDIRLLNLASDDTVVYAALPNVGNTLGEAHRLLRERLDQSPVLRQWWRETIAPSGAETRLEESIARIRAFGDHLKDEIVFTLESRDDGRFEGFLVLAELARPEAFRPFLEQEVRTLRAQSDAGADIRIVEDPSVAVPPPSSEGTPLLLWIRGDLFAASTSLGELRRLQGVLDGRAANPFAGSPFHASMERAYREGTTWLVGVDVKRIMRHARHHDTEPIQDEMLRRAGILDARDLVVEGRDVDGATRYRAVLTFDQPRRGIASWLAAPGPMGALDFVSPDAALAVGVVTKNPVAMTRDLFDMLGASEPGFRERLAEFERVHGVDVENDFAAPLGGEFAIALDGPVVPVPSWKIVAEVYDPERLQRTIRWAVDEIARSQPAGDAPPVRLETEESGGRTWFSLRAECAPAEVHYTFVDGYVVAGPTRALVEAAILTRASGVSLPSSSRFLALLPQDGNANFSAVAYQNVGHLLAPLAKVVPTSPDALSADQRRQIATALDEAPASLVYAYGEPDRVVAASTRPGGLFGSDLDTLIRIGGLLRIRTEPGLALPRATEGAALPEGEPD